MKQQRYGRFNPSDYWESWFGIIILFGFSTASLILDISVLFAIVFAVYALIWLLAILLPNCERFIISNDSVFVSKGIKMSKIALPSELTLVLSYADICPPFAMRTPLGNQTHVLRNKYAVSILRKMPLETTLETLHQNHLQKYTISTIETAFGGYCYIYSFVCSQFLLEKLVAGRRCLLIVPESLLHEISLDPITADVYIDKGF